MRTYNSDVEADVKIGETIVSIRRKGSSEVVQANIVSSDRHPSGNPSRIWLDRLVHAEHESTIGGLPIEGAYVTEIAIPERDH